MVVERAINHIVVEGAINHTVVEGATNHIVTVIIVFSCFYKVCLYNNCNIKND
jgi:hypothetical protein